MIICVIPSDVPSPGKSENLRSWKLVQHAHALSTRVHARRMSLQDRAQVHTVFARTLPASYSTARSRV